MFSLRSPFRPRISMPGSVVFAVALAAACSAAPPSSPAPSAKPPAPLASTVPAGSASPATCVIDGTVRNETGAPVAGALVAVIAPFTDGEAAVVRSKDDGAFCIMGLPAGEYGLTITSPTVTSAYVDVFPVGGGHNLQVKLGGEGFVLRGRIADQAGRPAAKRIMRISRLSNFTADLFLIESGDDGTFAVRLPRGEYFANVRTDDSIGRKDGIQLDRDVTADIVTTPLNPRDRPPPAEVVAWVKQKAIPLASAEAGRGLDDMEPLRAVVGSARVVALGEATHGTREFFQMKHRMLEFLVEKMGFRAFAIEATFPETLALDEYVRTGKGDPYAAVAAMRFWTWDTEEVVEMVRWMRRYNEDKAHKEKLRFFGFDMQFPAGSVSGVAGALGELDKKLWGEVEKALEPLDDDWQANTFDDLPAAVQDAAVAAAAKVVARFDEKRDSDVKKLGAERWALARIHAHVVADYAQMVKKQATDFSVRDRAMADNTLRLLEMLGPSGKLVLWAHNGHVQKRAIPPVKSQGHVLAEKLGKEYLAFGLAFDQGSFQAIDTDTGIRDFTVGAAPAGSLDGALAAAGLPLFAIDLRTATGPARTWLHTPTASRTIGSVFSTATPEAFFDVSPPAELFDALLFAAKTTAARATPTGKRDHQEKPPLAALTHGGFEDGTVGRAPPSWSVQSPPQSLHYRATVSDLAPAAGKLAVLLDREPSPLPVGRGSLAQSVDAKPLRGKRARVSAKIRLNAKAVGDEAFVFATVRDADGRPRSVSQPATPSKEWRETSVEVDIPQAAARIDLGVVVTGGASVGVDDITLVPVE